MILNFSDTYIICLTAANVKMKLTIKDLQQRTFQIDIDESKTVEELKKQIEIEQGEEFSVALHRLIYAGQFLVDDKPLAEYKIKEDKFLVLMPSKTAIDQSELQPAGEHTPKVITQTKIEKADSIPDGVDAQVVDNIVEMGYSRVMAIQALQASFNDADRAVEYLLSEIPVMAQALTGQPLRAIPAQSAENCNAPSENPLAFLRNSQEFRELRTLVRNDIETLQEACVQIAKSNPDLYRLILDNKDAFLDFINEEDPPNANDNADPVASLSDADLASINRLKEFGFSEHDILAAFLACEKNEDQAADLLFQNRDQN